MRITLLLLFIVLTAAPFAMARADLGDDVNAIRARGCEGRAGLKMPLRENPKLDNVAREWSKGGRLRDAIKRTDYRMVNSASMHIEGGKDHAAVVNALADNYCEIILDETFTEIGSYQQQQQVWVVVATPLTAPSPGEADTVARRVLSLVNKARAQPRKCGRTAYSRAPPLELDPLLNRAALAHAKDMTSHNRFEHVGSDGSRPSDRVTRTGYKWRSVGENIAAGSAEVDTIVAGWLESPGHCANIMSPKYQEMGIAFFADEKSEAGIYWAQVFATPR